MNRVVQDHVASGYITRVEYRAVKEPDEELDYVIRYYPGPGARESNERIQKFIRERRRHKRLPMRTRTLETQIVSQNNDEPHAVATRTLITYEQIENERLVFAFFSRFGITISKSLQLVTSTRDSVLRQLEYWPFRTVTAKNGLAGWMIAAIERDYAAPQGFVDAVQQKAHAAAAQKRVVTIESCQFCDERGFIKIESRDFEGQVTMRICTHDSTIEGPLAAEREAPNNSKTSPDAIRRSALNDNSEHDKRAADGSTAS